jgi:hypothetical protein
MGRKPSFVELKAREESTLTQMLYQELYRKIMA